MQGKGSQPLGARPGALETLRRLARMSGLGALASRLKPAELRKVLNLRGLTSAEAPTPEPNTWHQPATAAEADQPMPTALTMQPTGEAFPSISTVALVAANASWLQVSWQLSAEHQAQVKTAAGRALVLRLMQVHEDLAPDGPRPMARLEVTIDANSHEWWLPVPVSGQTYRVELGLREPEGEWLWIASSSPAEVPSDSDEALPPGASPLQVWDVNVALAPGHGQAGVDHERFYQLASSTSPRLRRVGSELLHDQNHAHRQDQSTDSALHDSGVGLWASGRSASGAGISGAGIGERQRAFWLVADAQLIVHGATEPSAQVRIGDEPISLEADGTFHIHVPFPDGEQRYPIEATAADGEQKRWKQLDFHRSTPQAQVNRREEAIAEWF